MIFPVAVHRFSFSFRGPHRAGVQRPSCAVISDIKEEDWTGCVTKARVVLFLHLNTWRCGGLRKKVMQHGFSLCVCHRRVCI